MRRGLARLVVAAVAVWPLVPLVLAFTADVDPWKLFSFGMYATPLRVGPAWQAQVLVEEQGALVPYIPRDERLLRELDGFLERRSLVGRLASSRRVADLVFEVSPTDRVVVNVFHLRFGADDRLIEAVQADVYVRTRPGSTSAPGAGQ